jgi:hypothetical protein
VFSVRPPLYHPLQNITGIYGIYRKLTEFTNIYRKLTEFTNIYRKLTENTSIYRYLQKCTETYGPLMISFLFLILILKLSLIDYCLGYPWFELCLLWSVIWIALIQQWLLRIPNPNSEILQTRLQQYATRYWGYNNVHRGISEFGLGIPNNLCCIQTIQIIIQIKHNSNHE